MPQIEVQFDIAANGILNVSAKDKATGKYKETGQILAADPLEVLMDLVNRKAHKRALVDVVRLFSGMDAEFSGEGETEHGDETDGEPEAPQAKATGEKAEAPAGGDDADKPTEAQFTEMSTLLAQANSTLGAECDKRKWRMPITRQQAEKLLADLKAGK